MHVILNFHGLGTPERDIPAGELPYWLTPDHFEHVVHLAQHFQNKPFRIDYTFDDGNASDVDLALPILSRHGISAKFFVLSGQLNRPGFLSSGALKDLLRAGMQIGSHGVCHPRWSSCSKSELDYEIDESLRVLSAEVSSRIAEIAIPFGAYDRRVLRALRQRRLTSVFTSDGGRADDRNWLKPRKTLRNDTPESDLIELLSGRTPFVKRVREQARVWRKMLV